MSQKVLLVTGGSSDIGAALVRKVSDQYDKIVVHYHNSTKIIQDLQTEFGGKIVPLRADFSSYDETSKLVEFIAEQGLVPSHFVHLSSSSSGVNVKFNKSGWSAFERELNIIFRPAVMCCHAFAPYMAKARYGKIVIMLSALVVWEPHKPYSAVYTCAKHALYGLVKSLASEYAGN